MSPAMKSKLAGLLVASSWVWLTYAIFAFCSLTAPRAEWRFLFCLVVGFILYTQPRIGKWLFRCRMIHFALFQRSWSRARSRNS